MSKQQSGSEIWEFTKSVFVRLLYSDRCDWGQVCVVRSPVTVNECVSCVCGSHICRLQRVLGIDWTGVLS